MENKFYSLLDVKSIDDAQRIIKGIATDVSPDHVGDRIDLQGIELTAATVPLLIQHDHNLPIGTVTDLKTTAKGLMMTAKLPTKVDSPELQSRIDTAYSEIKEGLRTGLSIGFIGLDWEYLADDTRLFGVVCGRGRNPTLRLWPTIFSGKIDVFPGDRRSRLISSMTSVAPA